MFALKWRLKHKHTGEIWKHPPCVCLALKPDGAFLLVDSTDPWTPRVSYQCMDKEYDLEVATTKLNDNWLYVPYQSNSHNLRRE